MTILVVLLAAIGTSTCGSEGAGGDGSSASRGPAEAARGRRLVEQLGCLSCHSTDGRPGVGPTWEGLAGSRVQLAGGQTVLADGTYLTRAIIDPDAEIVAGYQQGIMAGAILRRQLTEDRVADMVAYLQSLGQGE